MCRNSEGVRAPQPSDRVIQYIRDTGVQQALVLSRTRTATVSNARRQVMQKLRDDGFSNAQIGRWLGRHPSTISVGARAGQKGDAE